VGEFTKLAIVDGIMGSDDKRRRAPLPERRDGPHRCRARGRAAGRALAPRVRPRGRGGVPAHVTILAPFLDGRRIDASVISGLRTLFASQGAFAIRFARCGRFPGVLYLAPEPAEPLVALTGAVAGEWPEAPPYGGQFSEVIPHLTVVHGRDEATVDAIEPKLAAGLPILASVEAVHLIEYTAHRWRERQAFALGRPAG
jgi:2'-5' RNA ligase